MAIKISERFSTTCAVVTNNSYDTCGTITRSDMAYLTPENLEALFSAGGLWADIDAWFRTAIEMKACGTQTYGLYDWIMSGADRERGRGLINTLKVSKNPSILFPYILAAQKSVINTDFWAISTGYARADYAAVTTGPLSADDLTAALAANGGVATYRIVRVITRYGVDLDEKWFVNKDRVQIFSQAGGVSQHGQWKVLASAVSADATYVDVAIASENAGSDEPYSLTPTAGVLLPGINNVNDYESWCVNRPNLDGKKIVPFWFQTDRRTRCTSQLYREWYSRLSTSGVNRAFVAFGDIPEAERNAQDEHNYQKRWVNSFFYNKPIGTNQTLALWQSLEDINTPTGLALQPVEGGKLVGKRANFIGAFEQLRRCDRVRDLANQKLNLIEFFNEIYQIKRARESAGRTVTDIDVYTNESMKADFFYAMLEYYKSMYNDMLRLNQDLMNKTNKLGMTWDSYYVAFPSGVRINIISHPHFDDWRNANKVEGQESVGNSMLILDLGKPGPKGGTIYWASIASNRKVHKRGELELLSKLDSTYSCIMENFTEEQVLQSDTGTVIVECPALSLVIRGIAPGVPITTGVSGTPGDLY